MEEDEHRKIDLKQHTLPPVSRKYLLRIGIYLTLLAGVCYVIYYINNLQQEPRKINYKDPKDVKEIRGVTLSDSL